MLKTSLLRRALAALAFVPVVGVAASCASGPTPAQQAELKNLRCSIDIRVTNMACREACPLKVRDAVTNVDGVDEVRVDYDEGRATIEARGMACKRPGTSEMVRLLNSSGYKAYLVGVDPYPADPYSVAP
ncbi:MAG: heavy metal-associated domain-containing protein [Polyangiaceae bacterium]